MSAEDSMQHEPTEMPSKGKGKAVDESQQHEMMDDDESESEASGVEEVIVHYSDTLCPTDMCTATRR